MKPPRIEIPSFQNWSCHGCGDCCRGRLLVGISAEEKQRIEAQGWTGADGVDRDAMIVCEENRFRLGHQSNGDCVFLDGSGRCRIHARFGEEAKPLACRLYPFAIHPAGKKLAVSLRFSCPSAVANRGKPLSEQSAEIRKLANAIVPAGFEGGAPPPVWRAARLDWPDFLRFVSWLDAAMSDAEVPVTLRFLRALHQLKAVEHAQFDRITGPAADEILSVLSKSARGKLPSLPGTYKPPSRLGRFFFRSLILEYARLDTVKDLETGGGYQWNLLWPTLRFAAASSTVPALGNGLKEVALTAIERPFGPLQPAAESMLTRLFRVKIQGLHFCGPGFYGAPLIEGFRSLALLYPVILWISRWLAAGDQRTELSEADVARAIALADYHHGYSPTLGTKAARWRVQLLARHDEIARLCWRYGH